MENFLRKSGWTSIISSLIFIAMGIIMIINPEGILKGISVGLAIIFIILGIIKIFQFVKEKGNYNFYNYDLIYGIVSIIIGLITFFFLDTIETFLRIIIGLWIFYSGIIRIDFAFKLKSMELKTWVLALIFALCMIGFGIFIIANKAATILILGILIIVYAIMDLVEGIFFMRNVNGTFIIE